MNLFSQRKVAGRVLIKLIILQLAFIVFSCSTKSKDKNVTDLENSYVRQKINDNNRLEIITTQDKVLTKSDLVKNTESELIKRAEEYFKAIHNDNFDEDTVKGYMYPGIFTYVKNNVKGHYYETDVTKSIKMPVVQFKKMVQKANASYQTDVGEIGKRINSRNKKIYFLNFSMTITKGMDSYTLSDQILGISLDKYDEWTFLEANETAREILRAEFNSEDITRMIKEIQAL